MPTGSVSVTSVDLECLRLARELCEEIPQEVAHLFSCPEETTYPHFFNLFPIPLYSGAPVVAVTIFCKDYPGRMENLQKIADAVRDFLEVRAPLYASSVYIIPVALCYAKHKLE